MVMKRLCHQAPRGCTERRFTGFRGIGGTFFLDSQHALARRLHIPIVVIIPVE